MSVRFPLMLALALLVPLCLATIGIVWVAAGERMGATPFAGLAPRNSAEAAALGRAGDVLRFLRRGDDPHAVFPLHPAVVSSAIVQATTLEAALWSRQVEMMRVLDQAGAIDADDRRALACLAADLEIEDVMEYLAPGGAGECEPGVALARVVARTSGAGGER